jgi:hypothetical protein
MLLAKAMLALGLTRIINYEFYSQGQNHYDTIVTLWRQSQNL